MYEIMYKIWLKTCLFYLEMEKDFVESEIRIIKRELENIGMDIKYNKY